MAQKVAEPAAWLGGVDNRTGYLCPLSFIIIQSFLSAPFFSPSKVFSTEAFEFIFTDPDFYKALKSGFILAFGLVIIAIPLGGIWPS